MGFWGSTLYSNDSTCDVRGGYLEFLQDGLSNDEAYDKTLEKCREYIGDQCEPLMWFALAETQWKVGRLRADVKAKALEWIEKNGGLDLWEENPKGAVGWQKTLQKLKDKLNSPMPNEKKIQKPEMPNQDPWKLNDVYAWRMESEYARDKGYWGKYVLLQKIDVDSADKYYPYDQPSMRVHLFDKAFDEIPIIRDLEDVRILPLSFSSGQLLKETDKSIPNSRLSMSAGTSIDSKKYFPAKKFIYIGNVPSPSNKMHKIYRYTPRAFNYLMTDDWFITFHKEWDGIEYEIVGDGEFRFVPRVKPYVTGLWHLGIFGSDMAGMLDRRFIDTIRNGCSDAERDAIIMTEFGHYIGTYMEPLFWYVYAEKQWHTGCPTSEVREKALEWLSKDGGMDLWDDNSSRIGWGRTLDNLREKLKTLKRKK